MPANAEVQEVALAELKDAAKSLMRLPDNEVYGIVFYGTESLDALGLVYATRSGLAKRLARKHRRPDAHPWPDVVDELDSGGWDEGLGKNAFGCPRLNDIVCDVGDPGLSKRSIELALVAALVAAQRPKGPLRAPCFSQPPFVGIHLPGCALDFQVRTSKHVNDPLWHEKMLRWRDHQRAFEE